MSEEQSNNEQVAGDQAKQQFVIQKIYLKDVSLETPNSPDMFRQEWKPDLNVNLHTSANPLTDGVYEVVLSVTATTKVGDKTAFLVEVQQAGIFTVEGFSEQDTDGMLGAYCPNILFPYAREAISDLVTRAGFPQLLLQPVNFDALYAQHLQERQQKEQQEDAVH